MWNLWFCTWIWKYYLQFDIREQFFSLWLCQLLNYFMTSFDTVPNQVNWFCTRKSKFFRWSHNKPFRSCPLYTWKLEFHANHITRLADLVFFLHPEIIISCWSHDLVTWQALQTLSSVPCTVYQKTLIQDHHKKPQHHILLHIHVH